MAILTGCCLLMGIVLLVKFIPGFNPVSSDSDSEQRQQLIVVEVDEHGHEVTLVLAK